jgi:hypothetical protein
MIDAKEMATETPSEHLRVAIVGPENNGKSHLATTMPGVKLFLDYDQKKQAIAGKKDVYAITFKDPGYPKMPEAAEEIIDIIACLENTLDLSRIIYRNGTPVFPHVPEGTMITTIVHDSMASLGRLIMNYELYNSPDLRRTIKLGPKMEVQFPKNFDAWNAEMSGVLNIMMRTFALPVNNFCIFHERAEESADSTLEKPKFTGRVGIYPVRYKDLLIKYFTDIWRVKLTSDAGKYIPKVYVKPDWSFDSGTAMNLDQIEEADIAKMLLKHKSRTSQQQVSPSQGVKALPQSIAGVK